MMLAIPWNRLRFHVLGALPKDSTYNSEDYRNNILTTLCPLRAWVDERTLIIH
jgi:hypothetical protein